MREAASRGFFLGSKAPFGYTRVKVSDGVKDRPTLEVDPVAAPIVKEIFESSRRGNGLAEICKELNGRGITNRGKRWYKGTLHCVLRTGRTDSDRSRCPAISHCRIPGGRAEN